MPAKKNIYQQLLDSDLVSLLKDGDHDAYTEIYNRYHQSLIAFAYKKIQDEDATKDLVQDLFVKLWVKRDTLHISSNLPGYLITALKNNIFNFMAHQKVASKYFESLSDFVNTGNIAHTDYPLREKEFRSYLEGLVELLPKKMGESFKLSRLEYRSNREIAKELNTSEHNVSQHVNNALRILKTKLYSFFL